MSETNGVAAPEAPKGLVKKLAEVMAAVQRIAKRGRNDFHGYNYATEADIAEQIRGELAQRHIMLIPGASTFQRDPVGEKGSVLTTLAMTFTFMDGETGESIERPWFGAGTDKEDKGLYKAFTGGEKYFLLKTFLLPTGDDPEREDGKNGAGSRAERREAARAASARDAAENGPYSDRERQREAAKGRPANIDADGVVTDPEPAAPEPHAVLMARREKLPEDVRDCVPTDDGMLNFPPTELTDAVPGYVESIKRMANERRLSSKERGDLLLQFFGSRNTRLDAKTNNPFFVYALYKHMDPAR